MYFDIVQVLTIIFIIFTTIGMTHNKDYKSLAIIVVVLAAPFGRVFGAW